MAVKLSALPTDRALLPGIFLVLNSVRGRINQRAILALEELGKFKKKKWNDLIGMRTRDLQACSLASQAITLPRSPLLLSLLLPE
jgi:hypothetical protein